MDIYWIADKKKCGPATVPDIISRVQMGELTPETKGWHVGCEQWMPLRELPALADFLQEKPQLQPEEENLPPVPGAAAEAQEKTDSAAELPEGAVRVYLPSPASRMLARFVDMALYTALVFGVIYARQIPFDAAWLPGSPLMWIGFVVLETVLVHYLGTTPGKALLGIQIRCVDGSAMTIGRAMSRACLIFIAGMGMMVSLLPLFMMGYSWWQLRSHGAVMWDVRCRTLPIMFSPVSRLRQLLAVVLVFACVHTTCILMEPWLESMVVLMEQQSPEAGRWMRSLMPPNSEK